MRISGVVLAAGAGRRMGAPKALLRDPAGEAWVAIAARLLLAAGCDRVVVVLGASAAEAAALVPADAAIETVVNPAWEEGMGSSLAAGLLAASGDAALVAVVDMPELPPAVAQRVAAEAKTPWSLARAVFGGRPGHPVLIGSEHWAGVVATLGGDTGARAYLDAHDVTAVECGDLYDGHDVDVPAGA
jgi:CTP:molybdopterin cytidylyltransferase MocA